MLRFLQSLPEIKELILKQLTKKLTTLLALEHCQTLANLDMRFMQELPTKIVFTIRGTLKTTRHSKHLDPIEILPFPRDLLLCPVAHIRHYVTRTQLLCKSTTLPVSYVKPHTAVPSSTVAPRVKSTLENAGIDVNTFSAHSSRTAALSYGYSSGLLLSDILKAGGWSNAEGFAWHYNKPIAQNSGSALLGHYSGTNNETQS